MASERFKRAFTGKFIVIDGPDGSGKTTQAQLLCNRLNSEGLDTELLRDPGSTAIGEKIRQILLSCEHNTMTTQTEVLLYMAARVQLWYEKIEPALSQGRCVILDRWLSSTCAYQGCAGGFGMEQIERIAEVSLPRIWPDVTVILDVSTDDAARRINRPLDRMEQKGLEYHQRVRQGFLSLAKDRDDFIVIDATAAIEQVHQAVIDGLLARLG